MRMSCGWRLCQTLGSLPRFQSSTEHHIRNFSLTTLHNAGKNFKTLSSKEKGKVVKTWNRENKSLYGPVLWKQQKLLKTRKTQKPFFVDEDGENQTPQIYKEQIQTVNHYYMHETTKHLSEKKEENLKTEFGNVNERVQVSKKVHNVDKQKETKSETETKNYGKLDSVLMFPLISKQSSVSIGSLSTHAGLSELQDFQLESSGQYAAAYPGVTTILGKTRPPESQFYLDRWQREMTEELGEEGFKQHMIYLQTRGSLFHDLVQRILQGVPRDDITPEQSIEGHWHSIQSVLPDVQTIDALESSVRHPHLHYSGVIDCVATYRGQLCLIDWKMSSKRKASLSSTFDNPLQVAAYMGALNFDDRYLSKVQNGMLVIAYEDGQPADVHQMSPQQCTLYWGQWLHRLHTYWKRVLNNELSLYNKRR